MRKIRSLVIALAIFIVPAMAGAGCSAQDVCGDVLDTLVLVIGGEHGTSIAWESDSEPQELGSYVVVRSQDPGTEPWTDVEVVTPEYECGSTWAEYEVIENPPPEGEWVYGVQVYNGQWLVCTVVDSYN